MRDLNRRRVAAARSHHASPEDLAAARQRLKEIEEELRQITLVPETTQGEEREYRYTRVLRLRAMRDEFQAMFPIEQPSRANNLVLALVMTVASFLLCAFCAAGTYLAVNLINQQPDPITTANAFWSSMEQADYTNIPTNYFSPVLREQLPVGVFSTSASNTDKQFGRISNFVLVKQSGNFSPTGTLTYTITRTNSVKYQVILQMSIFHNAWGVSDLGNTLNPVAAGVPNPQATVTPAPSVTTHP